jgi:hypothetical protein
MAQKRIRHLMKDSPHLSESTKEKLDLWDRAFNQDDTKALMKLSLMRGVITADQYEYYLNIEKEFNER